MNELEQLKQRVAQLEKILSSFRSSGSIPVEYDAAFRNRLGINALQEKLIDSGVAISTITQAVDEGGAGSYNVLAEPDYLLRMKFRHLTVGVPAYDF